MFSNSEKLDSSMERLRESSLSLKAPTVYLSHFNSCQVMHSRLLPQCKQSFSGNHESVLAAGPGGGGTLLGFLGGDVPLGPWYP